MSEADTKQIIINIKELSFKREQLVVDLIRFLSEQLPQIEITRMGNEIEIIMPMSLSKRVIRLRIRKFLYKKGVNEDFRPISLIHPEKDGYVVKEKKLPSFTYY